MTDVPQRAQVVVIGGGVIGTSTACHRGVVVSQWFGSAYSSFVGWTGGRWGVLISPWPHGFRHFWRTSHSLRGAPPTFGRLLGAGGPTKRGSPAADLPM